MELSVVDDDGVEDDDGTVDAGMPTVVRAGCTAFGGASSALLPFYHTHLYDLFARI